MTNILPNERIERSILLVRGHKVMLDADLAILYGVSVGRLNEAVKRNRDRFPDDFMFQLSRAEFHNLKLQIGDPNLKSQIAISSSNWGGRRRPPYAFTEQGVAMLSGVLRSKRAAKVNIEIMRAFVRLRQLLSTHRELAQKLADWNTGSAPMMSKSRWFLKRFGSSWLRRNRTNEKSAFWLRNKQHGTEGA